METRGAGIAVVLAGGLGNQLFELCAAYITAKHHSVPLYLLHKSPRSNEHNKFGQDYNESVFKNLIESSHILQNLYGYSIPPNPYSRCYLPYSPEDIKPGSVMMDYYQYYPPLEPHENELRRLILGGLEEHRIVLKGLCSDSTAFIHIRRGDYVGKSHMHFLQPIEYYEKAYSILIGKATIDKFYIVSDDIAWVKEQPFFQGIPGATFWEDPDELKTLALLSLCVGGAICANSTFSWWGAFLGAHGSRTPVIMPEHYFIDAPVDLFPKEWIIL